MMGTQLNNAAQEILTSFKEKNTLELSKNLSAILEASPPLVKQLNEVSNSKYITKKLASLVVQHNQKNLSSKENDIDKSVLLKIYVRRLSMCLFTMFLSSAHGISPPLPPDESHDQTSAEINKHLPSHPLTSKQVIQIMTTLIELPFAKIDKKNIEKLFSVELKELTFKSNRWRFDAKEDWSIVLANSNQIKKKNVNLTIFIRKYNNSIKKYAESDIPICFSADDLKSYLESNKWEVPRERLQPPSPGHHEPYEYFVKNKTRINFSFLKMDTQTKTLNCIYEFYIGYRK